eukprot:10076474-Prorocentrum_lima.AAC.1
MPMQHRQATGSSAWISLRQKGMTFKEIAKEIGDTLRSVQFDFPPGDVCFLRALPGMEDYD